MGERRTDADAGASGLPRRFGRNALSNYALAGVLMAVALVTTPILTRHLGPQRYGIWVFVGSAVAYVQLLDLGFGGAVVAAVARLSGAGDHDRLERTLSSAFVLLVGLGLVALAVAGVAAAFLPAAMHLSPELAGTTRVLLLLLGVDMALSIPLDTFGCGLVALQRFDLLNATLIGVAAGQAVAWTLVLLAGGGLLQLGIVTVAISLVGQAMRFVLLRRLLPGLAISAANVDRALVRSLASPAGWFALGDSIEGFRDYASVLVLGLVRNVAVAGIFAVGEKLATLGTKLGTPMTDPFFPHASELVGRGDDAELGRAARTGGQLTAGVTIPFCLVVAILARPALLAWVGAAYERAAAAVVILAVAFGLRSLGTAPARVLSGAGGQRMLALVGVAEVATQIVLTAVLGVAFGITGVAVAVLIAVVSLELVVRLPLVGRRLHTPVAQLVWPVVRAHLPALAVAGAAGWFWARDPAIRFVAAHGRLAGMGVVAVAGVAMLLLYAVTFAFTGLDGATRRQVALRLRGMRTRAGAAKTGTPMAIGRPDTDEQPEATRAVGPHVVVETAAERGV